MKVNFSLSRATHTRLLLILVTLLLTAATVFFSSVDTTAQDTTALPFRKDTLLKLVQSKQYRTENIIKVVEAKGVDFRLTDSVASEFREAGAFPELLDVIRSNYRPTNVANARNGSNSSRNNNRTPNAPPPAVRRNTPGYEDLVDRALDQNSSVTQSARFLQTAINLNPARPEAYQLMGALELYGNNNFVEAERYMRAAIQHGGDAVFKVYHDHDGFFNRYCEGKLYVSRNSLKYEANKYNSDGSIDSYAAKFSDIKEAQINRGIGRQYGAFHIKVPGSKRGNYNFAPATKNAAESRLILGLVQTN